MTWSATKPPHTARQEARHLRLAPELRRYIAQNGRNYTTKPFTTQPFTGQPSTPAGKATAAPEPTGPDHAPQKA